MEIIQQRRSSNQELIEQIRFKSLEFKEKWKELQKQPLIKEPFKDRDLLRFPSIMDDRKSFDKNLYVEVPQYNTKMSRNYKYLNSESSSVPSFSANKSIHIPRQSRYDTVKLDQSNEQNAYKSMMMADHNKRESVSPPHPTDIKSPPNEASKQLLSKLLFQKSDLKDLKEKRKLKLTEVLGSMRSKSSLGALGKKKPVNLDLTINQLREKKEIQQQYFNCTPALIDLILMKNSQNIPRSSSKKFLNKSMSKGKNTFISLFPLMEYHKKGTDSPNEYDHFLTYNEKENKKTRDIIKQSPECAPLNTDVEKMYFKKDDDLVKSKLEILKMQKLLIREPTPIGKKKASTVTIKKKKQ